MLPSLEEYERFIYTLADCYASIEASTLAVKRHGVSIADVEGEVCFAGGRLTLVVREVIDFASGCIQRYGYEVRDRGQALYWYDSQPHPTDPDLASTHPHHKHVPPDIKHNRQPAPDLSFDRPNLPFLIGEVEGLLS